MTVRTRFADRRSTSRSPSSTRSSRGGSREADEFLRRRSIRRGLDDDERRVQRQAYAGLLWSKQFYHYSVELWLDGDPAGPPPPRARRQVGATRGWRHVYHLDVLSVPDKWEYPWFAAWDTAFHCIPLARLDPEWAKRQLVLLLREWYMHPNGQLPAYEWDFPTPIRRSTLTPPAASTRSHAADEGRADIDFLEEVFHKLLLNFTWWVNRKDPEGRNAFQGGFLGLDNIGVFDRSRPDLAGGRRLEQADGTAWMGMFCLDMLAIALELARTRPAYEAIATKFFEHFLAIAHAINGIAAQIGMWHEEDGFYYDVIRESGGTAGAPSGPLVCRPGAAVRCAGDRPGHARPVAPFPAPDGVVSPLSPRRWSAIVCLMTRARASTGRLLLALADRAKLEAVLAPDARSAAVSLRIRPAVDVQRSGRASPTTATGSVRDATSRPSRHARCTAATRTGGGRSGSRSTT